MYSSEVLYTVFVDRICSLLEKMSVCAGLENRLSDQNNSCNANVREY